MAAARGGDNSDLDVAVLFAGSDKGIRLGHYCALGDLWQNELAMKLPVRVHLKNADAELNEPIVAHAVKRDGILVFSKKGQA